MFFCFVLTPYLDMLLLCGDANADEFSDGGPHP